MKSYTDLEQSKKLAEILPLESADMCFNISHHSNMPPLMTPYSKFNEFFNVSKTPDFLIPCWSLAALLDYLSVNQGVIVKSLDKQWEVDCIVHVEYNKELVDACVEMIIELHKQKLL